MTKARRGRNERQLRDILNRLNSFSTTPGSSSLRITYARKRTFTISYTPMRSSGTLPLMSQCRKVTPGGKICVGGAASNETSRPSSWASFSLSCTSRSHILLSWSWISSALQKRDGTRDGCVPGATSYIGYSQAGFVGGDVWVHIVAKHLSPDMVHQVDPKFTYKLVITKEDE